MILIVLMAAAGLAGCVGDEDEETTDSGSTMDASDGGYTYASNVDNHRSLMKDLCDIKTAASAFDFATAKDIYKTVRMLRRAMAPSELLLGLLPLRAKHTATMTITVKQARSMHTSLQPLTELVTLLEPLTLSDTRELQN